MENNELMKKVESKAVAKSTPNGETIFSLIEKSKSQIERALPQHMKVEHFLRTALTAIRRTPKLAQCTKDSLLGALMVSAQLGLEPSILGQCYLIPYGSECQFIIGYQGLLTLIYRSNKVKDIYAEVIYDKDTYEITYGLERTLKHIPCFEADRGKPIFTYAVATLEGGNKAWVVLPEHEVMKRKAKGAGGKVWNEWGDEMRKKTLVKYLAKMLPMSINEQEAIAQDETVKKQLAPDMTTVEPEVIDVENIEAEVTHHAV